MGKIIHNSDGSVTRTSSTGRKFTYKFQQGGETESQKQKRLYEEMQKLPEPKISDDTHYDETRKEWVPSAKFKSDTLFVSNPNDPRLLNYQDSLLLYNSSKGDIDRLNTSPDFDSWDKYVDNWYKTNLRAKTAWENLGGPEGLRAVRTFGSGKEGEAVEYKKPTQPVAYKEGLDLFKTTGRIREGYKEFAYRDTNGNYNTHYIPIEKVINFNKQEPTQIPQSDPNFTPKGQTEVPYYKQPKPDIKRRYYQEGDKYYMDFPDSKSKNQTIKRPISKETYRLGMQEQDEDLGIRVRYKNAGRIKRSC